jgi:hypothetical protein
MVGPIKLDRDAYGEPREFSADDRRLRVSAAAALSGARVVLVRALILPYGHASRLELASAYEQLVLERFASLR